MLVETDRHNGRNSIYECDRCKARTTREEIWRLKVGKNDKDYTTLCHLCDKCFKALKRGIKKNDTNGIKYNMGANEYDNNV